MIGESYYGIASINGQVVRKTLYIKPFILVLSKKLEPKRTQ